MPELLWFLSGCGAGLLGALAFATSRHRRRTAAHRPDPEPADSPPRTRRIELGETRALAELSAAVGRDLANHAAGIEGHAQHLCESVGDPCSVAEHAAYLWESVRHLRFFAEKLLSFSEIPRLEVEATNVGQLLAALVLEIEDYCRGSLQVNLSLAPSLPLAMSNPVALRTAVLFLVEAVLELEPNASTLLLQAESEDGDDDALDVRLDIEAVQPERSDTAEEPPPPIQFSYLAASNLLEAQGARFSLNHAPGLNALVSITLTATPERVPPADLLDEDREAALPATGTTGPQDGTSDGHPSPHHFGGVLIMEANPMIRDMVGRELRKTKRNIIECADGVAARSLFRATPERFELLILELRSRRMRGDRLALLALAQNPDLQIILLTPGPCAAIDPALVAHSQLHLLQKPFGMMELRNALVDCLGPEPAIDGRLDTRTAQPTEST